MIPSDDSNVLLASLYINLAFAPDISKPAPSACNEFEALEANTIILSLMSTTLELIVVVIPSTIKPPLIITVPLSSPCPAGSIVNEAGVYKVEPSNTTLPDTFSPLSNLVEPTTFKLVFTSIELALISRIKAFAHLLSYFPKL